MTTAQPATPVRVIYAKLTSTGDYDVVAKTDNIELSAARSLAEKLLLGNVPHEATIGEELAYLRPPNGGHLMIRYTTYQWKDANRGDAFMTDILWLNDADFARARNNAFAVMPRSDGVYDVLTTLPPVAVDPRPADADRARLQELAAEGPDLLPLMAGSLVLEPVLAVEKSAVHRRLELFTLLLPPSLRPLLTWQTRAFRVPAHIPRITVADAMHANLQNGSWSKVLPDVTLDVPLSLAEHLVREAAAPASLIEAHAMYERAGPGRGGLREEVVRLMGFVRLAHALNTDRAAAFGIAAETPGTDAAAMLAAVLERSSSEDVQAGVLRSVTQGGAGDAFALALLRAARQADRGSAPSLYRAAAMELIRTSRMPREDLAVEIVSALTAPGDAGLVVLLVGLDRRIAGVLKDIVPTGTPTAQWLRALGEASRSTRDITAAHTLLTATAQLDAVMNDAAARARLCMICREVIDGTLDRAPLSRDSLAAMIEFQDSASDLVRASPRLADCVPLVFSSQQLAPLDRARAGTAAAKLSESRSAESQALLAASLLQRASRETDVDLTGTLLEAARGALDPLSPQLRENVRRVLDEVQVRTEDLVALQGGAAVLPLLGRSAEQATTTRDLLQAARDLGHDDDAIARLATAVLTGRAAHVALTRTHQAFVPLRAALTDSFAKRKAAGREGAVAEVTLDLLSGVLDADAFADIETAVLGGEGMTVRLRRLDRAVALCRAAEDEALYERLAAAIESPDTAISESARRRLRDALGTGGVQRRLIQMLTGVVERGA